MFRRVVQGRPWIFQEFGHYLATGNHLRSPAADWIKATLLEHLQALHDFSGWG